MRRRDVARTGGSRVFRQGLSAYRADGIARLARAAEHAGAHDVRAHRAAERIEFGGSVPEQPFRLTLERLPGLALEPKIDEPLALPVEDAFAHCVLLEHFWPSPTSP